MANKITMTSPKGVAVYPRLDKPDTKFDDNGIYKADIKLDAETGAAFVAKLKQKFKDNGINPKMANSTFDKVEDDNGDETGEFLFKFRVKNKITKKGDLWDRQPAQFDAKGTPIAKAKAVGGGTIMRVSFEIYEWNAGGKTGVSLQPEAVQLIDLKEWSGQKDAADFGFGAEEGFSDDSGFPADDDEDDLDGDYIPSHESDDDDY